MHRASSTKNGLGAEGAAGLEDRKSWSIREPLQGALCDFIRESGFNCTRTERLVRDLVALLCGYREENVPLYPQVFVLGAVDAVQLLAPGSARVKIGTMRLDDTSAALLLKQCANVARGGWAIYVTQPNTDESEYGLFRALQHAYATGAHELMLGAETPIILVRNRGHQAAELFNTFGAVRTISLTSAEAAHETLTDHVALLVRAACIHLGADGRDEFASYFAGLLVRLIKACHGALIAVSRDAPSSGAPPRLSDGVWLDRPIDLFSARLAAVTSRDAETLATLEAYETLLDGMLANDGVLVLNTRGAIVGYRVFLKASEDESRHADQKSGGRGRAFAIMRKRVRLDLQAAFIRSQDGATDCEADV